MLERSDGDGGGVDRSGGVVGGDGGGVVCGDGGGVVSCDDGGGMRKEDGKVWKIEDFRSKVWWDGKGWLGIVGMAEEGLLHKGGGLC